MPNQPPKKENFFCVGVVTAAHGIKGEVTVKPFVASPEGFGKYGTLFNVNDVPFSILRSKVASKGVLIHFEGVNTRNDAERLQKTYLYASTDYLPELDENDMFLDDLIGTAVYSENDKKIGVIRSHFDNGAHTVIQIKRTEAGVKDVMIPFADDYILSVDPEEKRLVVSDLIEDFFDL
jgi:16S rRNA processing protein RimM